VISFFERRTFDPNVLVSSAVEISEAPQGTGRVGQSLWQTSKVNAPAIDATKRG
jgi:hypothetical protein